jgi:hypothetical protein
MTKLFKNWALIIIIVFLIAMIVFVIKKNKELPFISQNTRFWQIQAIDTVKYSRDMAGQYLNDSSFDVTIESQVSKIAATGVTHIALGTPYDQRFVPFLKRWVDSARQHNLKIWFRGNFSGWENWFEYKSITRDEHKELLKEFIKNNGDLFEDGDIFSSCTECENGGPGDPRQTGDTTGFRQFLIDEYQIGKNSFRLIGKNVTTNYFPVNYDVAYLVMDKETTQALGGVVVIDHYVGSPEKTNNDVNLLAKKSGGKIVIGEFGAPIPDIHGNMTEKEQADWIHKTFLLLSQNKNVIGVNYWTGFGGSTKLWNNDETGRLAVKTITDFYTPKVLSGVIKNEAGIPIIDAILKNQEQSVKTNKYGQFSIPFLADEIEVVVFADGYFPSSITNISDEKSVTAILKKQNESGFFKLQKLLYQSIGI